MPKLRLKIQEFKDRTSEKTLPNGLFNTKYKTLFIENLTLDYAENVYIAVFK
jgi:hypothetical protein